MKKQILFILSLALTIFFTKKLVAQDKTISPVFSFDAHQSKFLGQWIRVGGVKLGLSINKNFRYGIGFYTTNFARIEDLITEKHSFLSKMRFNYQVFFLDYSFINTEKWDVSTEFSMGSGRAEVTFTEINNLFDSISNSPKLVITSISSDVEYKILPYLGLSAGGGYKWLPTRKTLGDRRISDALNSFFYTFKVKIHLGEAYKTFTKK